MSSLCRIYATKSPASAVRVRDRAESARARTRIGEQRVSVYMLGGAMALSCWGVVVGLI